MRRLNKIVNEMVIKEYHSQNIASKINKVVSELEGIHNEAITVDGVSKREADVVELYRIIQSLKKLVYHFDRTRKAW